MTNGTNGYQFPARAVSMLIVLNIAICTLAGIAVSLVMISSIENPQGFTSGNYIAIASATFGTQIGLGIITSIVMMRLAARWFRHLVRRRVAAAWNTEQPWG